jgi:translation initiation factor IF-3
MKYDSNLGYLFDENIKENNLFVIDSDGTKYEKISLQHAIEIAKAKQMNVVLIVSGKEDKLAIARIVNKGKFLFEAKKKEKEKAKAVQSVKIKEITVRPLIGDNDLLRFANNTVD